MTKHSVIRSFRIALFTCLTATALAAFPGCDQPSEENGPEQAESQPDQNLSIRPPTLPGVTRCGSTWCGPGTICCNASCGICTGPNGICTQQICEPTRPEPEPQPEPQPEPEIECRTSADCRAQADYCTGCDCRALPRGGRLPVCTKTPVACYANPCLRAIPYCDRGVCRVFTPNPVTL